MNDPSELTAPRDMDHRLSLWARASGFLLIYYIAAALIGGEIISGFRVPGDFAQTAANIRSDKAYYQLGLFIRLTADLTAIAVGLTLWALLRTVDSTVAMFGLVWRVAEGVIGCVASMHRTMTMGLAERMGDAGPDLAALMSLAANAAFALGVLLFAIGSLSFFVLLQRTAYIPKWLSWTGVGGSVCAVLLALILMLSPVPIPYIAMLWAPLALAELAGGSWLLLRGIDGRRTMRPRAPTDASR
jgi:hypothetical protein